MAQSKDFPESSDSIKEVETKGSNTAQKIAWIFAGLLLVAAAFAVYFGFQSRKYQDLSTSLNAELDDTKIKMEEDLAIVQSAYDTQVTANEVLTAEVERRVEEVTQLQQKIEQARSQLASSKANSDEIKERLARMETLQAELEADLLSLQGERDSLIETNSTLVLALNKSEMKVEQMNTEIANLTAENIELDRRLSIIAPAGFRADNFRIDIERRNDKLTTKARRADEIVVKFDLDNVPSEKQGEREIYLTVTALDGNPISDIPTETISVPAANEPLQVSAADIEELTLGRSQTVAMSFRPDKNMGAGAYNIFIYSDAGYLGATGFRLR